MWRPTQQYGFHFATKAARKILRLLENALRIDPDFGPPAFQHHQHLLQMGRAEKRIPTLQKALERRS